MARRARRPSDLDPQAPVEIEITGLAHGGEGVGRLPDGRACFVPYTVPGERVRVRVTEQHKRYARARMDQVLVASPDRVQPPCPYFGPGRCGGCQLQHIAPQAQAQLKAQVVRDLLERIGGVVDPPLAPVRSVPALGYRTTARFAVDRQGRLGFRRARSHRVQPVDRCLLLDDATQALRARVGDGWHGAAEVTLRTGDGQQVVLVRNRDAAATRPPQAAELPLVSADDPAPAAAALTVTVDGLRLRVSPGSFFQPGPQGAALLLSLVRAAAEVGAGDTVLELFAGMGLFTVALARDGAAVTAVEANAVAAADLAANCAGTSARVIVGDAADAVAMLRAAATRVDVVVLDPPRRGAGPELSRAIAALGARTLVYVSCDPAALARDCAVLRTCGFELTQVTPVDQFPHTATIEAVATFRARPDRAAR